MKSVCAAAIISCILFASCQQAPNHGIAKLWLYTHYNGDSKPAHIIPTSFLSLQPDGTYTRDFGTFESGNWELQKDQLVLYVNRRLSDSYFAQFTGKILMLSTGDGTILNFESKPLQRTDDANPFSLNNNQWRIKATQKENDTLLMQRMINHVKYWQAYFTWAFNNNLRSVDVRSTATPIKIYGNGLTLKQFKDLPRAWVNLFYDEDDCQRANDLLEEKIKAMTIAWPQTDNKYKMFISAFQQLHDNLQEE
jgi:hypothetical protein